MRRIITLPLLFILVPVLSVLNMFVMGSLALHYLPVRVAVVSRTNNRVVNYYVTAIYTCMCLARAYRSRANALINYLK